MSYALTLKIIRDIEETVRSLRLAVVSHEGYDADVTYYAKRAQSETGGWRAGEDLAQSLEGRKEAEDRLYAKTAKLRYLLAQLP